jgi:hypothetical protein
VTGNTLTETEELLDELRDSEWLAHAARACDDDSHLQRLAAFVAEHRALMSGTRGAYGRDLLNQLVSLETEGGEIPVEGDHFVLALPLEQVAYHVNRTTMLSFLAPELRNLIRLSRHMDWMSGIQFYLRSPLDVSPGHVVGLDSTWALTAVEQTQFWKDVELPPGVKAILSVDIAAWDKKGRITRKEAYNCSDQEIAKEVWGELKEMLNRGDRTPILRDDLLIGGALARDISYHLDDTVVDLWDRRKQGFYERARGLRFNTLDVIAGDEGEGSGNPADKIDETYVWGPRRRFNSEPMLINRPGSRALRPDVVTSIPNLFLAGDYVFTDTDLACMEGANEAARRAVNAILDATASLERRCELWSFSPSRQAAQAMMSMGGAVSVFRGAAGAVSQMQDQFWKRIALGLMGVRSKSLEPWRRSDASTSSKRS